MPSSSKDDDKHWAVEYLLDPLNEPTPAEETGLGSSLRPTNNGAPSVQEHKTGATTSSTKTSNTNPFRRNKSPSSPPSTLSKGKAAASSHTREVSNGSTRSSTSGRPQHFPEFDDGTSHSRSSSKSKSSPNGTRPRRSSSLRERYPGDTSHHPLATLAKDSKAASRSPHLRKKHHHGSDSIDKLDDATLGSYHHESPYDAASLARNNSYTSAPLAALAETNKETLRATPRENIQDSLQMHRPLDGVAIVPPGVPDRLGRTFNYQEGPNMMIDDGGNYKRWPGVDYHPDDIKGKGEPSYTIEKQLKEHDTKMKAHTAAENGEFELVERPRKAREGATVSGVDHHPAENGHRNRSRSGSGSGHHRLGGELKKRFGSLRRKDRDTAAHLDGAAY